MTLEELYASCGGDYSRAKKLLRSDKMIDRFIRKFAKDPSMARLSEAYEARDEKGLFEGAHGIKGVASNIGLTELSQLAARIADGFRPGSLERLSDGELDEAMEKTKALYERILTQISLYEAEA